MTFLDKNIYGSATPAGMSNQADRVAELLRSAASSQQPTLEDKTDAFNASMGDVYRSVMNPNIRPSKTYQDTLNNSVKMRTDGIANQLQAESGVYDLMQKQIQAGNQQAKAVFDTIAAYTPDPAEQAKIMEELHKDPEEVTPQNMYLKIPAAVGRLGIQQRANKGDYLQAGGSLYNPRTGEWLTPPTKSSEQGKTPPAGVSIEQWKETEKGKGERVNSLKTNAQGAAEFLQKLPIIKASLEALKKESPATGGTGYIQGDPDGFWRGVGRTFGTDNEPLRTKLEADLADAELAVAKMELKGQGQVTENERLIARKKLPSTMNEYEANMAILDERVKQAEAAIAKAKAYDQQGIDIDQFEQQYNGQSQVPPELEKLGITAEDMAEFMREMGR